MREGWSKPAWLKTEMDKNQDVVLKKLEDVQNLFKTSGDADALAGDILDGKKAYNGTTLVTGTMVNNGAKSANLAAGGQYNIPVGYHNGLGNVTAADLASQTPATAEAANILAGETAWVEGEKKTGTMAEMAGTTVAAAAVSQDDDYTYFTVPSDGHYDATSKIMTENNNLYKYCDYIGQNVAFAHDGKLFVLIASTSLGGTLVYRVGDNRYTLSMSPNTRYNDILYNVKVGESFAMISAPSDSISMFVGILLYS